MTNDPHQTTAAEPEVGSTEWHRRNPGADPAAASPTGRTETDNDRIRDEGHKIAAQQRGVEEAEALRKNQIPAAARNDTGDVPNADPSGEKGGKGPFPKVPEQREARENAAQRVNPRRP